MPVRQARCDVCWGLLEGPTFPGSEGVGGPGDALVVTGGGIIRRLGWWLRFWSGGKGLCLWNENGQGLGTPLGRGCGIRLRYSLSSTSSRDVLE